MELRCGPGLPVRLDRPEGLSLHGLWRVVQLLGGRGRPPLLGQPVRGATRGGKNGPVPSRVAAKSPTSRKEREKWGTRRVRVKKILLILAAGMPSLENHEGWGNRFVVLHEAARMGQFLVEWQRKAPLLAKNARNGVPAECELRKSLDLGSRNAQPRKITKAGATGLWCYVPALAKSARTGHPARNGAPGFAQQQRGGPPDSRNRFIDPSTRKGRGSQDDKAEFKVWISAGA
jgi:hypothetical protein